MSRLRFGINVGDTKRGTTLGVAHFAANLIDALVAREDVETIVIGDDDVVGGYDAPTVITSDELGSDSGRQFAASRIDAMLQIHHFLPRPLVVPTMTIVHDMHLFTVAWKYANGREEIVERLEKNITDVDAVISHFPGTVDALSSHYPETADRLHLIFSPTLLADFEVTEESREWARRTFDLGDGVPTLLYPSQMQAHKNHWNLISALAQLRDQGRPVRLICTGSSFREYLTSSLQDRVAQRGLTDFVQFTGYVEGSQLRALYEQVSGVISPSLAEGGAYIAQEAIVHDTAVTCSDLASVRAHLDRLEVAIPLFDPMRVGAVVDAIEGLLDHGEQIVAGYARAREIERSWTWDAVAADVVTLARRSVEDQ